MLRRDFVIEFSVIFLDFRPKVSFNIRLLKTVQLMEFPLLSQWINQMVNDNLKLGNDSFKYA